MEELVLQESSIRLDQCLKLAGLVMSGGEAKTLIQSGMVKVNGKQEKQRGRQLKEYDVVTMPDGINLRICIKEE
jgi:ribosome-associated protein